MKKYIYKIENLVNGSVYIGQSCSPERRWKEHLHNSSFSLIHLALQKYGIDNFDFSVIEGPIENYNEREKYWISFYHSWVKDPEYIKGYNLSPGGEEPPILSGELNPYTTHSFEQVMMAKKLLKETDIKPIDIAKICEYADRSAIDRINAGRIWNDPDEEYPIRVYFNSKTSIKERWEKIAELLSETDLTHKQIAEICGCKRSCVTMINSGKNGKEYNNGKYTYPIRNKTMAQKDLEQRAREVALEIINSNSSLADIAKKYNCSYSTVYSVNIGRYFCFPEYTYPLRKHNPVETIPQKGSTVTIDT